MRTWNYIILSLSFLLFAGFVIFIYVFIKRITGCSEKGTPAIIYSESPDYSKKNKLYMYEMIPNRTELEPEPKFKFFIKQAWVEKKVYRYCKNGTWTTYEADTSYHMMVRLKIIKPRDINPWFYYFLDHEPLDSVMHFYSNGNDTIKVHLYRWIDPDYPDSLQLKVYDSIIFVRR